MKIAMPHTVDVPGRMFLGKREFQWEEAENCNRSKKSSRNSLVPILTKEREVGSFTFFKIALTLCHDVTMSWHMMS